MKRVRREISLIASPVALRLPRRPPPTWRLICCVVSFKQLHVAFLCSPTGTVQMSTLDDAFLLSRAVLYCPTPLITGILHSRVPSVTLLIFLRTPSPRVPSFPIHCVPAPRQKAFMVLFGWRTVSPSSVASSIKWK